MTEPMISIEGLGKKFIIRHETDKAEYDTLAETMTRGFVNSLRRLGGAHKLASQKLAKEEFWAVRDVTMDVQPGEVMGIIGRNGAGKSTLLKLLSRITEPSAGRIVLNGRVASLLEVGTGFHPELTGRENMYLNGAILGMSRAEVTRKFDEIVEFAGVEQFLDTPVKRYSSGMKVRLAFAVAAHLEPEILVVDEVLAVGDMSFQKKCLSKMQDVSRGEGRTVLFVSHNMQAVNSLCTRGVVLRQGRVAMMGTVDEAIATYLEEESDQGVFVRTDEPEGTDLYVRRAEVIYRDNVPVELEIEYCVRAERTEAAVAVQLTNTMGIMVCNLLDIDENPDCYNKTPGDYAVRCSLPGALLVPGTYYLGIRATDMRTKYHDVLDSILTMDVPFSEESRNTRQKKNGILQWSKPWRTVEGEAAGE